MRPFLHRFRGATIGRNVWISQYVYLDENHPEAVTIGDNTTIGLRTSIFTHFYWGPRRSENGYKEVVIENNVFIVTGGSRGIGFEITKQLLAEKAKAVICARKKESLDAAAHELNTDKNLLTIMAHVAQNEDVENLFSQALNKFGRIDGLINNVGMNIATGLVDADPVDVALPVLFLCSEASNFITGQTLMVDGGSVML